MTVTTRRERREQELRRRQRESRGGNHPRGSGGGGGRPGWLIGLAVFVLFVAALVGLNRLGVLSTGPAAPTPAPLQTVAPVEPADKARGVKDDDLGNAHVNVGQPVQYPVMPPTSGSHWPSPGGPLKAGSYDAVQPFEATVHNLEHGGIVIVYNGLSTAEVDQLKQFVRDTTARTKYVKILLEPYPGLQGAKVTATAWRWRLNLDSADTASLLKFISVHYDSSDAPEPGAGW
jgi:hypothetical protein